MSIIPIRCFTCGKITGNNWQRYEDGLKSGRDHHQYWMNWDIKDIVAAQYL